MFNIGDTIYTKKPLRFITYIDHKAGHTYESSRYMEIVSVTPNGIVAKDLYKDHFFSITDTNIIQHSSKTLQA